MDIIISNIFPIISIIIGITGLVYGITNNKSNPKSKRPAYKLKTTKIIEKPDVDGLNISYKKQDVKSLSLTKVLFINDGKEIISSEDVVADHSIFIETNNDQIKIYSSELEYTSKQSFNFEIEEFENGIEIHFDYVNPSNGCIIKILHSGSTNASPLFRINGELKGVERISEMTDPKEYVFIRLFISGVIVITTFVVLTYPYRYLIDNVSVLSNSTILSILNFIYFGIAVVVIALLNIKWGNLYDKYSKKNIDAKKKELLKIFHS